MIRNSRIFVALTQRMKQSKLFRNVAILAGGTIAGQGLVVISAPLLTRLYSPEQIGAQAVFMSLLATLTIIAALRFEIAIPLPEQEEDAAAVALLALVIIPMVALIFGVPIWLLRHQIGVWTKTPMITPYLWMLPLGICLVGFYQVGNHWALRHRAFKQIAQTKFNQGLAMVTVQLACFKLGTVGLMCAHVAGSATGGITQAGFALREHGPLFRQTTWRRMIAVASRYRRLPTISTASGFINTLGLTLPPVLMATFYGPGIAGQFALVQRIAGWPVAILTQSISQVYFVEASVVLRESPMGLRKLYRRFSRRLTYLAIPIVILSLAGPTIFSWVFGARWSEAGEYLRCLGVMFAARLVVGTLAQTLFLLERLSTQLILESFHLVISAGSIAGAGYCGASPTVAIAWFSGGVTLSMLILWFITLKELNTHHRDATACVPSHSVDSSLDPNISSRRRS